MTRPSKASPREENGAIPPSLPLCTTRGTPIETAGCWCALIAASAARATRSGTLTTGMFDRLVDAEPAGRELRPVDDDGGRARAGGVLDRELRVGAAVDERCAVGDEAAALAVEERAQPASRRARGAASSRSSGRSETTAPASGKRPVEHEVEPDAHGDRDLLGVARAGRPRATVSAAGAPPGLEMLPKPGPAGPSLPAGATTSVSSCSAPWIARASGESAKAAYETASPTSAIRAASWASPSRFGSTARSSPAISWSVRA